MLISQKCRAKRGGICYPVVVVICICGSLDLLMFKVIWGHLVHLNKMSCNSKTTGCRAKRVKYGDSGCSCHMYTGCLGPFSVEGYLGLFGELVSNLSLISKTASRRWKQSKI